MPRRAVFLDRDGVLNDAIADATGVSRTPACAEDFRLLPGVMRACEELRAAGFVLVVVTNQPDVARGRLDVSALEAMHARLRELLPLDAIQVCVHDDTDACECRKPAPGMLTDAARDLDIDLANSYMVGDRWRDVGAGRAAGCTTMLVQRPWSDEVRSAPDYVLGSLPEAVRLILADCDPLARLRLKIFADGANLDRMLQLAEDPRVAGFTTNPTLMRASGVHDYLTFARHICKHIDDRPVSLEVFADTFPEMERQAMELALLGEQVYVKIPITDPDGRSSAELVARLASRGVRLNVTAVLTMPQVREIADAMACATAGIISVFAGRIADTGRDPVPMMTAAARLLSDYPQLELLWASSRELLNVFQAESAGCHIITMTEDLLSKFRLLGRDLTSYSLDTVRMFRDDAHAAGYVV